MVGSFARIILFGWRAADFRLPGKSCGLNASLPRPLVAGGPRMHRKRRSREPPAGAARARDHSDHRHLVRAHRADFERIYIRHHSHVCTFGAVRGDRRHHHHHDHDDHDDHDDRDQGGRAMDDGAPGPRGVANACAMRSLMAERSGAGGGVAAAGGGRPRDCLARAPQGSPSKARKGGERGGQGGR